MTSCGNPNVEQDAQMQRRLKYDGQTKICVKCKENAGNVVIRHAIYCKSCFIPLVQTRFKRALEPSINPRPDGPRRKALKASGSLVIGFSGGTCSTTLLDLVAKTFFSPRPVGDKALKGGSAHPKNSDQRIWKDTPAVCYVELCGAFPEQKDHTEEIKTIVHSIPGSPLEFVPLKLEDAFDPSWWKSVGGPTPDGAGFLGLDISDEGLPFSTCSPSSSPLTALKSYLSSLPTLTAINNAVQTLVRLLLLHTAASRGASHLLLGTSLTSLSVNLISGIAQGSGFAVAEEAKEEWTPTTPHSIPVRVIRPLRDVGVKECAIWNWWAGLRPVDRLLHQPGAGRNAIDTLTRDFIFGLETDYPSTVSTIARTCGKLASKESSDAKCVLCERPAQPNVQAWKAQISIRSYSDTTHVVSGSTRPPHLSEEEISQLTCVHQRPSTNLQSLTPHLCYACHTTLTSRSSRGMTLALSGSQTSGGVPMPVWIRSTLGGLFLNGVNEPFESAGELANQRLLTKEDMRDRIGDFLMDE